MKASIRWIKELLPNLRARTPAIAQRLTAAGFKVTRLKNEADGLIGVVAAEVRALEPHPHADNLRVVEVFDGTSTHTVVSGAPNVAVGQKVAFAAVGLTLADG
ncbi:MAG: phenylalanine--tRNA ligase subunit beta, partial [Myxococcota bacterium]